MTELALVLIGVCLTLAAGCVAACWYFHRKARNKLTEAFAQAGKSLVELRQAASDIAQSHNDLALTQAEHARTLETLRAEVAGRSLRR